MSWIIVRVKLKILFLFIYLGCFFSLSFGQSDSTFGKLPDSIQSIILLQQNMHQDSMGTKGSAKKDRVEIINTDIFQFAEFNGEQIRKLLHNVHLRHDSTDFLCDSAYQYIDSNVVHAFSDVKIYMSDSVSIYADFLRYDVITKVAYLKDSVQLIKEKTTLNTNDLTFYQEEDYGYYKNGGTLLDGDNILSSYSGHYFTNTEMAYFKGNVVLDNPKYQLETDTLGYDTETETALFSASTIIHDEGDNMIYTERGFYDTRMDLALFSQAPYVKDSHYTLRADTIYYDRKLDFGRALHNVRISKSDTSLIVYSQYAEFEQLGGTSFLTDSVYAIQFMDNDSLFLFADTLYIFSDSIYKPGTDTLIQKQILKAFYNTYFFMGEMQGICDSMYYDLSDSVIKLYHDPVLWSDDAQITGTDIIIRLRNEKLDSMKVGKNAFIAIEESDVGYNQIKGQWIYAKFSENKIRNMRVEKNCESVYFARDDKAEEKNEGGESEGGNNAEDDPEKNGATKDKYIGMNEASCKEMFIKFKDNKPVRINFSGEPKGIFYPMHETIDRDNELDGFKWRLSERPIRPKLEELWDF